jgi:hypothetical protein
MSGAFDVSDVVNLTQDKLDDGEEIVDVMEQKRRDTEALKETGHGKIPNYKLNSLCCLKPRNPLRRFCMRIVHHHLFNKFIILTICANCVFLAINDPICGKLTREKVMSDPSCSKTTRNIYAVTEIAEYVFLGIFSLESCLKIVAQGLFREKGLSYLRDPWNWLDFLVVVIAWLSILNLSGNLGALRAFRVLRPLRTLTAVPGMRLIIVSMLHAGAQLGMVGVLCLFVFFVFGIIGIQFWAGLFEARCHIEFVNATTGSVSWILDDNDESLCGLESITLAAALAKGLQSCDSTTTTCSPAVGRSCDPGAISAYHVHPSLMSDPTNPPLLENITRMCRRTDPESGPSFGFGNFDNIGYAIITIITSITLEGWVDNLYNVQDSFGRDAYFSVPYFFLLIIFGSCFLLNLFLAVIWLEYDAIALKEKQMHDMEEAELNNTPEKKEAALKALKAANEAAAAAKAERMRPHPCCSCASCISRLVTSLGFELAITFLIILNTISLAVEFAHMPDSLKDVLSIVNYVFAGVFLIEMILKLIGLGVCVYLRDNFNIFDAIVVVLSFVEIVLEAVTGGGAGGLSVFRSFRLIRVFKLARSWKDLRELLETIMESLKKVSTAAVLLFIIIFIFSLIGTQLFAGEFTDEAFDGDKPSAHFDTLGWAFVTVFQVLTGENWNEVLYNGMKVGGTTAVMYFLALSVVGNYVILNLFLAILLEQFEAEDEGDVIEKDLREAKLAKELEENEIKERETRQKQFKLQRAQSLAKIKSGELVPSTKVVPVGGTAGSKGSDESGSSSGKKKADETKPTEPPEGRSFFILGQKNPLRVAIFRFTMWKPFDMFILALIGISSINLAIDEPYIEFCDGNGPGDQGECEGLYLYLKYSDWVLTGLFTIEMMLKMVSLGFVGHKGAYWRDAWNILDGFIVIISIIAVFSDGDPALRALRSFRALRGLRPLRVVRRYPGMKLVVNSIFKALPKIYNVVMVTAFFFLIFAIVGVQNWKGSLNRCNDPEVNDSENNTMKDCVGMWAISGGDCHMLPTPPEIRACEMSPNGTWFPRIWAPLTVNFDHIGNATLTVYEITSGEMWPDIMYDVVAATPGVENVPLVSENNMYASLYFVFVIFVCSFIMLNVFIGVVIDNFNKMKSEEDGSALMTEKQKKWVDHIRYAMSAAPLINLPPPKGWRRPLFKLVESSGFDWFIMITIMMNTALMATRHAKQSQVWNDVLYYCNLAFVIIFTVEAILKLIGLNPYQYFRRNWNKFDFTLVLLSYVGMIGSLGGIAGIFRIFRVARIFRLIKSLKGLRILFQTVLIALPSVVNVGAILLLTMFIFAVMGMNLFAHVKWQENLNRHANFWDFGTSMTTLFRCFTGESYNAIMHDARVQEPYCSRVEWIDANNITRPPNCGQFVMSPFFFCIYFLISNYILLNLLVAIIIDSLVQVTDMNTGAVKPEDVEEFKAGWARLDPDGDHMIPIDKVCNLIISVSWPLGLRGAPGSRRMNARAVRKAAEGVMLQLDIKNHNGEVNFHETIVALMDRALGSVKFHEGADQARQAVERHVKRKATMVSKRRSVVASRGKGNSKITPNQMTNELQTLDGSRQYTIADEFASRKIQYAWRKHKSKRRRKLIFNDGNDSDIQSEDGESHDL